MKRAAWLLTLAGLAAGQPLAFDVTSVKPRQVTAAQPGIQPSCSNGRFLASTTLNRVIWWALELQGLEAQNTQPALPAWTANGRSAFEIQGQTPRNVTEPQCREMVLSLLRDRFKFASHWEQVPGEVYELTLARGGPKLQRVTDADTGPGVEISINGRPQSPRPDSPTYRGMTMAELADALGTRMDPRGPGVDKTGLEGRYKFRLAYSIPGLAPKQNFEDPELDVAIQQQLGLKLERKKGAVRKFVLDRLEMPDEN